MSELNKVNEIEDLKKIIQEQNTKIDRLYKMQTTKELLKLITLTGGAVWAVGPYGIVVGVIGYLFS